MPAGNGFGAVEAFDGGPLFVGGEFGRVGWIEADENHFVVAARIEGKHAESADDAHLNLVAEHWAVEINEGQDHGLLAKKLAKLNVATGFVAEMQIERHSAVERRLEANILQGRRHGGRGWADVT